jgi:hypothetical protein
MVKEGSIAVGQAMRKIAMDMDDGMKVTYIPI